MWGPEATPTIVQLKQRDIHAQRNTVKNKAPIIPTDVGALPLATSSAPHNAICLRSCVERQGESGTYMRTCPRPKTPLLGSCNHPSEQDGTQLVWSRIAVS